MRLDPKYFNLFIAVCAVLTLLVIIYGTINYTQKQRTKFQENSAAIRLDTLSFGAFSTPDTLFLNELHGSPIVIQFWSTWSEKSIRLNQVLDEFHSLNPDLEVVAAAVRDDDEQIRNYITRNSYSFHYVDGTPLFQELLAPGIPSQILVDRKGDLYAVHVGDNRETLISELEHLLQYD